MPTLVELKNKWFIPMDGASPNGVPQRRHSDSAGGVSVSTDNNLVEPIIDGQVYMREWHDGVVSLTSGDELYHAAWRFEDVKTLGNTVASPHALQDVVDAHGRSATVYPLTDRNLGTWRYNNVSIVWLRLRGVWNAVMDNRFPAWGSNHHKFAVLKHVAGPYALVGSIDISKTRWDTPAHAHTNADRDGRPTHDTGVKVRGPAIADVEITFRERWNDSSRTFGIDPPLPPLPLITTPLTPATTAGSHSVQALRTYGITNGLFGYSWYSRGEFTAWASYLNAIKRATTYIYIEDQYFLPFDWPPCHTRTGLARDTDLIYQLGEAMKRGVRIAVLLPNNAEDPVHPWQKYQRDIGVNYLRAVKAGGAPGDVVFASLENGTSDVYVHSKLMIVDDEFVLIGSANVAQRSMTHDGELHLGIVDANGTFARDFRKALWQEHSGHAIVDPPVAAYTTFQADTAAGTHHLTPYRFNRDVVYPPTAATPAPPAKHPYLVRTKIDPYAGPAGIR